MFPFFREASLLQMPRSRSALQCWCASAFRSGLIFASHYPDKAGEVLEAEDDLSQIRTVVQSVILFAGPEPGLRAVAHAFSRLAAGVNLTDDQIDENTAALGQQALRAGLFAQLCEPAFAEQVKHEWERTNLPLHEQALINAVSRAQEQSVYAQLRHPLLHIAAENYSTTPLAGQAILGFFNRQLIRFGVKSENDCPVDDYAIAQWIECGIEFGREMSDSEQVKAIVAELGETRIAEIRYINHGVLQRVGDVSLLNLARAVLWWFNSAFPDRLPHYYGSQLDRVVRCADFAIWLGWLKSIY